MKIATKIVLCGVVASAAVVEGFAPSSATNSVQLQQSSSSSGSSALYWFGGGSGAKDLDEEWERQQEVLKFRNASPEAREKYFKSVEDRRIEATEEQIDKWAWQTKKYAKGEDPIDEWRKRRESDKYRRIEATEEQIDKWAWQTKKYAKGEDREFLLLLHEGRISLVFYTQYYGIHHSAVSISCLHPANKCISAIDEWRKRRESGQISDLDNQYGDEEVGGIPFPMASFGVGGEFGVGGKFDNGGRFDLRLPYADQGYVDEEDEGNPISNFFGGGKKKKEAQEKEVQAKEEPPVEEPKKNGFWPF
eukprot:CAMPEP_0172330618 /NCGR_PEP_ID=MMETSP1058-20130122/61493_1 /TAXON_ID=83371 /ORGANISM="Detonula confervacea, Strain CCMP 353" /LENGTH=304 /DNA_ID=CAMNT_0013047839 /DNA_START=57 /DNA_END=974 /DNA_ORIENTATION=-